MEPIPYLSHNLSMIHILCLNPTIDRMYYINSFLPGFQYHGNKAEVYPGGKGLNILRVLSSFIRPLSFYAFTAGDNGKIIKKEAERLRAQSSFIEVEGETRTTINIMDKKSGNETEIKEKGPYITEKDTKSLITIKDEAKKRFILDSSIIPEGVTANDSKYLAQIDELKKQNLILKAKLTKLLSMFKKK